MKNFLTMTRVVLKSFFRKSKNGKNGRIALIVVGVLGALLGIGVGVLFGLSGQLFASLGVVPEMTALLMDAGFIVVLVFGTVGIFSYVYFSPDNEFLLSLPVRSSSVYLAKLFAVYLQEVAFSTVIILPGVLALGISTFQPWTYYIMLLLALAFIPVCAMLLASIISIPLVYLASFFKNRGAVSTVVLIILFASLMGVYMYFASSANGIVPPDAPMNEILAAMKDTFVTTASILYPIYALAQFGSLTPALIGGAGGAAVMLAIFLGTVVVSGALTWFISSKGFAVSALRQTEHGSAKSSAKEYVSSSVLKALVKKEWRELSRNTSFAFQCLAGIVVAPVLSAVFMITGNNWQFGMGAADNILSWTISLAMILIAGVGMNQAATTAITREGKSFAYSKTMPVPYTTQLLAKVILCNIIGGLTIVFGFTVMTVVAIVRGIADPLSVILSFLLAALMSASYVNLSIAFDLRRPRLDWSTPREAVKNNYSTLIPIFGNMIFDILCIVLIVALTLVFAANFALPYVGMAIAYTTLIILAAAALLASAYLLRTRADKYYDRLSV